MSIHYRGPLVGAHTNVTSLMVLKNGLRRPHCQIRKRHDVWLNTLTGWELAGSLPVQGAAHTGPMGRWHPGGRAGQSLRL